MKKISISVLFNLIVSIGMFIFIIIRLLNQPDNAAHEYTLENLTLYLVLLSVGIVITFIAFILKDWRIHILAVIIFAVAIIFSGPFTLLSVVFVICSLLNFSEQRRLNLSGKISAARAENYLADANDYDAD